MSEKSEAHRNYEVFARLLPDLAETHADKCALLHDGELVEIFDTNADARFAGRTRFGRGKFSVQRITARPADLGWFSHVSA